MQTMKVALAVLCVAVLLIVGECTKTKVKKSSSKSQLQWKKEEPVPEVLDLLKRALNDAKCPHDVPCKRVDQIISVKHKDEIIIQKYDIQYTVKGVTGPFDMYFCEIVFLMNEELTELLKIVHLQCTAIFEPIPSQEKTGKV